MTRLLGRGRTQAAGKVLRQAIEKSPNGQQTLRVLSDGARETGGEFVTEFGGELLRKATAASVTGTEIGEEGWMEALDEGFLAALVGGPVAVASSSMTAARRRATADHKRQIDESAQPLIEALSRQEAMALDPDAPFDPEEVKRLHGELETLDTQAKDVGGLRGADEGGSWFDLERAGSLDERLEQIQGTRQERLAARAQREQQEAGLQARAAEIREAEVAQRDLIAAAAPVGPERMAHGRLQQRLRSARDYSALSEGAREAARDYVAPVPSAPPDPAAPGVAPVDTSPRAEEPAPSRPEPASEAAPPPPPPEPAAAAPRTAAEPPPTASPAASVASPEATTAGLFGAPVAAPPPERQETTPKRAEQAPRKQWKDLSRPEKEARVAEQKADEKKWVPVVEKLDAATVLSARGGSREEIQSALKDLEGIAAMTPLRPKGRGKMRIAWDETLEDVAEIRDELRKRTAESKPAEQIPTNWRNALNEANVNAVRAIQSDIAKAENEGRRFPDGELAELKRTLDARRESLQANVKGRETKADPPKEYWDIPDGVKRNVSIPGFEAKWQTDKRGRSRMPVVYAVVPRSQVRASTEAGYDAGAQNRTLTPETERAVLNIVDKFEPSWMTMAPRAQEGAPIVTPYVTEGRRDVEVGNHRVLALDRLSPEQKAEYTETLVEEGFDVEGIEDPVLVRVRAGEPMDPATRTDYAEKANASQTQARQTVDRAREMSRSVLPYLNMRQKDIRDAGTDAPDLFAAKGTSVVGTGDRRHRYDEGFFNTLEHAFPPLERPALWVHDAQGHRTPTPEFRDMAERALLRAAFDSDQVVALLKDQAEGVKMFTRSLVDAAPSFLRLKAEVARGSIPDRYDVSADIVQVLNMIAAARSSSQDSKAVASTLYEAVNALPLFSSGGRQSVVRSMYDVLVKRNPEGESNPRKRLATLQDPRVIRDSFAEYASLAYRERNEGRAAASGGGMSLLAPPKAADVEALIEKSLELAGGKQQARSLGLNVKQRKFMARAFSGPRKDLGLTQEQVAEVEKSIFAIRRQMLGRNRNAVSIRVARGMEDLGRYYGDGHRMILLASRILADPETARETMFHELLHAMRDGGLIEEKEWDGLMRSISPDVIDGTTLIYPELTFEERFEEAAAETFAWYAENAAAREQTPVQLFDDILSGKVGERDLNWQSDRSGVLSRRQKTISGEWRRVMLRLAGLLSFVRQALGNMSAAPLATLREIAHRIRLEVAPVPEQETGQNFRARRARIVQEHGEDIKAGNPDNLDADGKPLRGAQEVVVSPSGRAEVNYRPVASSIGLTMTSLPRPGKRAAFKGTVARRVPLVNRWEVAQHPFGAQDGKPLPWYRPEALTPKQRDMAKRYSLARQPLPNDLAAAVRGADAKTGGDFSHVSFRDGKVWAHRAAASAEEAVAASVIFGEEAGISTGELIAEPKVRAAINKKVRETAKAEQAQIENAQNPPPVAPKTPKIRYKEAPVTDPKDRIRHHLGLAGGRPHLTFKGRPEFEEAIPEIRTAHLASQEAQSRMWESLKPLLKDVAKPSKEAQKVTIDMVLTYDSIGFWPTKERLRAEATRRGAPEAAELVGRVQDFFRNTVGNEIRQELRRDRAVARRYVRRAGRRIAELATPDPPATDGVPQTDEQKAEQKETRQKRQRMLAEYARVRTRIRQAQLDHRAAQAEQTAEAASRGEDFEPADWGGYELSDDERTAYSRGRALLQRITSRSPVGAEMAAFLDDQADKMAVVDWTKFRAGYFPHRPGGEWRALRYLTDDDGNILEAEYLGAVLGEMGGFDTRDDAAAAIEGDFKAHPDAEYVLQSRMHRPDTDNWTLFDGSPGAAARLRTEVYQVAEAAARAGFRQAKGQVKAIHTAAGVGGVKVNAAELDGASRDAVRKKKLHRRIRAESTSNTLAASRRRSGTKGFGSDLSEVMRSHMVDVSRWVERNRIQRIGAWALHQNGAGLDTPVPQHEKAVIREFRGYIHRNLGRPSALNRWMDSMLFERQPFGGKMKPGGVADMAWKGAVWRMLYPGIPAAVVASGMSFSVPLALAASGVFGAGLGSITGLRKANAGTLSQRHAGTESLVQFVLKLAPTLWHMGFAATNLTQPFVTTASTVGARHFGKGWVTLSQFVLGKFGLGPMTKAQVAELEASFLRAGIGMDPLQKMGDVIERSRFSPRVEEFLKWWMISGAASEWVNRAHAFTSGLSWADSARDGKGFLPIAEIQKRIKHYEKNGMQDRADRLATALDNPALVREAFAAEVENLTQFDYGLASRPPALAQRAPGFSDVFQFRNYFVQLMGFYHTAMFGDIPMLGADPTKERTFANRVATMAWLLPGAGIAGLRALAPALLIRAGYEVLAALRDWGDEEDREAPVDPKLEWVADIAQRAVKEDKTWEDRSIESIMDGWPTLFGVAMGGRAGLRDMLIGVPGGADPLRSSWEEVLGPGAQGDLALIKALASERTIGKAIERYVGAQSPGIGGAIQASRTARDLQERSTRGRLTGREQRTKDTLLQFFGMTPNSSAFRQVQFEYSNLLQQDRLTFMTRWRRSMQAAITAENNAEQDRLIAVLASYGRTELDAKVQRIPIDDLQGTITSEYQKAGKEPWEVSWENMPLPMKQNPALQPDARPR